MELPVSSGSRYFQSTPPDPPSWVRPLAGKSCGFTMAVNVKRGLEGSEGSGGVLANVTPPVIQQGGSLSSRLANPKHAVISGRTPVPASAAVIRVNGCVRTFPVAIRHSYPVERVYAAAASAIRAGLGDGTDRAAVAAVEQIGFQVRAHAVACHVPGLAGTGAVQAASAYSIAARSAGTTVEVVLLQVNAGETAVRMSRKAAPGHTFIRTGNG